jgi:hypothetical protein
MGPETSWTAAAKASHPGSRFRSALTAQRASGEALV